MPFTHPRMRRERKTIEAMFAIYCRDQHAASPHHPSVLPGGQLCADCQEVQNYAVERLDRCPFQENKPTCANCAVHCYKPEMRQRVRQVMRYAGPRMLLRHPVLAVRHMLDGKRKPPAVSRRVSAVKKDENP
jgi:hypothetical protein